MPITVQKPAEKHDAGEIEALAGCDRLTISPALLEALVEDTGPLPSCLSPEAHDGADERSELDEAAFRLAVNDDAMATEKLAEGIRHFIADQLRLETAITS